MTKEIKVTAVVNNLAQYVQEGDFLVVRRDSYNSSLWFYGAYDSMKEASKVADEVNGIVLKALEGADDD